MKKLSWRERYSAGGICDFRQNYDFYFKWLLNKVCSCFVVNGLPETVNQTYMKSELILSGCCCITDFDTKLYACRGDLGGKPDEYYRPTVFVIANPILGSKQVNLRGKDKNGVCIFNTDIDSLYGDFIPQGLEQLINQTATMLADNIISINANQINSRVATFFTADSESQAIAGETILKNMYAGKPFQILRSDIVEKININPVATASTSSNITELVELHNYIISNFFQTIGIKANNLRKRERLITDEINSQNDYLKISVLEILASWQRGFDEVNKMYDTDINVTLSPAIIELIAEPEEPAENVPRGTITEEAKNNAAEDTEQEAPEMPGSVQEEPQEDAPEAEKPDAEQEAERIEAENDVVRVIAEAAAGEVIENEDLQAEQGKEVASDADGGGSDGA